MELTCTLCVQTQISAVCASPRNLTWFTRPFLLVRGWGLGMRLIQSSVVVNDGAHMHTVCRHINICCVQTDREGNFVKPLCSFVSQEFAWMEEHVLRKQYMPCSCTCPVCTRSSAIWSVVFVRRNTIIPDFYQDWELLEWEGREWGS